MNYNVILKLKETNSESSLKAPIVYTPVYSRVIGEMLMEIQTLDVITGMDWRSVLTILLGTIIIFWVFLIRIDKKFKNMEERFDKKFDKIDEKFKSIDERFDKVYERFDKIDERFAKVDEKIDKIDAKFEGRFTRVEAILNSQGERLARIEGTLYHLYNPNVKTGTHE